MKVSPRTWLWVQVAAGTALLVGSAVMRSPILGLIAIVGVAFGLVALFRPQA